MSGWGYFFLFLLLIVILAPICWIVYTRIRASRAGLPPPPLSSYNPFSKSRSTEASSRIYPASRSPLDWVKDKFSALKGRGRTGGGAYEPTHPGAGTRRGLDPDEAWDSRVGAEADAYGAGGYYEEQELGLHPPASGTAYTGATGGHGHGVLPDYGDENSGPPRGRSLSRDMREENGFVGGSKRGLDERYEEVHGAHDGEDPFGDEAERSELRGVSPRPAEEDGEGGLKVGVMGKGKRPDSPTERRSMFRENV